MKTKLLTIALSVFAFTQIANGQTLKSYSGNYGLKCQEAEVPYHMLTGKATYGYYENDDYKRIRKGKFTYAGKVANNGVTINLSINGNYSNNLKNGLWKSVLNINNRGETIKTTCLANYSKGNPNGAWRIDAYSNGKKETIQLNFTNNVVTGAFSLKMSGVSLNGKSNSEGYLDGIIKLIEGNTEMIMTYDHGFLVKYIVRNTQTGDIQKKIEADPEQLATYAKIKEYTAAGNTEALLDLPFKVRSDANPGLYEPFNKHFTNTNLGDALPGDLSYPKNKYEWSAFRIKLLDKQETRAERLERERLAKLEAERKEKERLEKERKEKERLARIEAERIAKEKRNKAIAQNKKLMAELGKNRKAIESRFRVIDPIATSAMGSNVYKTKRKALYEAYKTLLDHYLDQLKNTKEIEDQNAILIKANKLNTRTIELFDQKNKDLEKALKKADSAQEIEKLLITS
ncbi:hypothetical protein OAB01_04135 [Bacteroidia bacterium]|nr:hypothetical protein [Bacteroidia bacterium]